MHKISIRLSLYPQCAIYAQDFHENVLLSPIPDICIRFPQDCTSFSNAQYMQKVCARFYFFLKCTKDVQDLWKIVLISSCAIYVQDLQKI